MRTRPAVTRSRTAARVVAGSPRQTAGARHLRPQGELRLVRVRALDPCVRCGPSTSVEQLYRVDEQIAGKSTVHMVYFDRHGWYCVHGASCIAVRDVQAELKAQRGGRSR